MTRFTTLAALCAFGVLSACGSGNPFSSGVTEGDTTGGGVGSPTSPSGGGGGGTSAPTAADPILLSEPDVDLQAGYVDEITYDPATDTFTVDDLAFDGDTDGLSNYARGTAVATLDPVPQGAGAATRANQSQFRVYENAATATDQGNGTAVNQFVYRAIYGETPGGTSRFAIVRTGSYAGYGFGGFVYQRDGGVTIPTTGQGAYEGEYAGLRDFTGRGGLEYVEGRASVAVDFEDFNEGDSLRLAITDRRVLDLAGNDITGSIIAAYNAEFPTRPPLTALPTIISKVGPGTITDAGVATGGADSTVVDGAGALETFEEGNYYAILSGDDASEIAGVLVVTNEDPRFEGVTARETGGFLVYR